MKTINIGSKRSNKQIMVMDGQDWCKKQNKPVLLLDLMDVNTGWIKVGSFDSEESANKFIETLSEIYGLCERNPR